MTNLQSLGFCTFFILQRGDGSCKAEGHPGGRRTEDAPRGAEESTGGRRTKKVIALQTYNCLTVMWLLYSAQLLVVFRIRDFLVRIGIGILGSVPLTNGYGFGSGSCPFSSVTSRMPTKNLKIKSHTEVTKQ
jgi:hypothetical protein